MAFQYAIGAFTLPAGSAPYSINVPTFDGISGGAFDPVAVLVYGNMLGDLNGSNGIHFRIGLSDGIRNFGQDTAYGQQFAGYSTESYWSDVHCLLSVRILPINRGMYTGYLTMGSGQFVVHIDTTGFSASAGGAVWNYVAFGGSGVQAHVNYFRIGGSSTVDVTDPGFRPTALLGFPSTGPLGPGDVQGTGGRMAVGFATDGCGLAGCAGASGNNSPTDTARYQRTDQWLIQVSSLGAVQRDLIPNTMLPTGFRVTQTLGSSSEFCAYLALNGVAANVVSFIQAGAGALSVPITATLPRLVLVAGANNVASAAPAADHALSFGAGDITTQRSVWTDSLAGQAAPFKADSKIDTSNILNAWVATAGPTVLLARAALTALASQSIAFNFSTSDGIAREWLALVFADLPTSGDPCGGVTPPSPCIIDPPSVPDLPTGGIAWGGAVTGNPGRIV